MNNFQPITWLIIFDNEIDQKVANLIFSRWPAQDSKGTLGYRSTSTPVFNSILHLLSLSTVEPEMEGLAAQIVSMIENIPNAKAIKVESTLADKGYVVILGPQNESRLFLGKLNLVESQENVPLWNIENRFFRTWVFAVRPENVEMINRLERAITDMEVRIRRDGGIIHLVPAPRMEYFEIALCR